MRSKAVSLASVLWFVPLLAPYDIHGMNMADDTPYSQFIIIRVMDIQVLWIGNQTFEHVRVKYLYLELAIVVKTERFEVFRSILKLVSKIC